jgi:hypothetical protein
MFLLLLKGVGLISHQVPIKFPSITRKYAFGFIKFPKNSHQIALVLINNPSKSFVLIKFSSNPFCSHQVLIKILLFPQLPINFLLFPTQPYINPHKALNFVRDLGRVLNGAPQFLGRPGRGATVTGRRLSGAAEQKVGISCLPGFVEDRGQICF